MAKEFKEKVVWITGGGSGIGRALAEEFAGQGATVIVSGRRRQPLEESRDLIDAAGGRGGVVICDVNKVTDVEGAVEEIVGTYGGLDVVVANAGFSVSGRIEEMNAADWRRQFETNVFGLVMTVKYAIPHLRKTKGRIALMGSVAGTIGLPNNGAYSASKFAVRGIGQTLTAELAADGISCTTLLPGFVESDISRVDNQGRFREDWEDRRNKNFMWPADRAARVMVRAIEKRRTESVITGHGKVAAFFGCHAPRLTQLVMGRAGQNARPKKSGNEDESGEQKAAE